MFNSWVNKIPLRREWLQYSCLENPMTEEPGGLQSMGSQRVKKKRKKNFFVSVFMEEYWCVVFLCYFSGFGHVVGQVAAFVLGNV